MAINSLSAASKGISGLASGMDTQQMVESMLAGTQNKIDSANQKKTQLTNKQTLYRDLITKLNTFKSTFFSFSSSSTNLLSTSFFNTMQTSSTSTAFKVTAGSSAMAGKTTVNYIKQLAQNEKAKSQNPVTGKLEGKVDAAKLEELVKNLDKNIVFQVEGGSQFTVNLKELVGTGEMPNGMLEMEKILQSKLGAEIDVAFEQGQMRLSAQGGKKLTITTDGANKEALGIFGVSGDVSSADGTLKLSMDSTAVLPSLSVTMNGVKKNVAFNPLTAGGSMDAAALAQRLNASLQKAFGAKVQVTASGTSVQFKTVNADGTPDSTSQLTLASANDGGRSLLGAMGITSGKSNKINTNMTLKEANFASAVVGDVQKFTINGVDFSVDSSRSIFSVVDEINRSEAGVTITYLSTEDRFQIESKVGGKLADGTNAFSMSQTEGNFLTALFGVEGSNSLSSGALKGIDTVSGTAVALTETNFADSTAVVLNIDGTDYTFDVKFDAGDSKNSFTFITKLNEAIDANAQTKGKVSFRASMTNNETTLTMKAAAGVQVTTGTGLEFAGMQPGKIAYAGTAKADTLLSTLGMETVSVTVGGAQVTAAAGDTVASFQQKLEAALKTQAGPGAGVSFEEQTGRYRIFGVDIPITLQVSGDDGKLFGTTEAITIGKTPASALAQVQAGQNAVLSVNGVEIERNSNEFTLDGIGFELTATTPVDGSGQPVAVNETIQVTRNTDQIYDGIVKFVEEYNKLVDSINEQLDAEPNFRKYPPLTEKQKSEMSEKEIEMWEEKSKQGLLRGDSALQGVLGDLRSTLYTKPEGGLALYDIGVTTSYFGTKDHLELSDPAKLKQMIAENPEGVQKLFTDTEKGLSTLLNKAIERAAKTDTGSPGTLVRQAGVAGRPDTASNLYKQIKSLDDRLTNLNQTYNLQYNRYWKQFNSMEQMISQMNQQSAWLTQQFSS